MKLKKSGASDEPVKFREVNYFVNYAVADENIRPPCYWCGGELIFKEKREVTIRGEFGDPKKAEEVVYQCTTFYCRSQMIRRVDLKTLYCRMGEEDEARERGMIKKRGGGNRAGRRRQQLPVKRRQFWEKW